MPLLIFVVNEDRFFLSHRLPIALAAKKSGYEVIIVAKNTGHKEEIEKFGFRYMDIPMNPTGMNPFQEFKTLHFLISLYRKTQPSIVHHVGLKNILWGGLAAKICKVGGVVNAVSGLGGLFNNNRLTFTTRGILSVMRFSNNRKNVKVIFQNDDDREILLHHKVVEENQIEFTKGSGVDLDEYSYTVEPETEMVNVIFTARMVKEKGVCDLIEAAEMIKDQYSDKVRFILCGRLTPNKTGVTEEFLNKQCDGKYVCWLGERDDVKELLQQSHIMAFPSYYREGVPKSLIEASAIGRPIITCDSTGCRDVVEDGVNGFLIEPHNPPQLAEALKKLIDNKELRIKMGRASRIIAERDFSIDKVVDTHLKIYKTLILGRF